MPTDPQKPTVGRIVLYRLTAVDAENVNRRRRRERRGFLDRPDDHEWPEGAQMHVGLEADAGDTLPLIVVSVHYEDYENSVAAVAAVNGQVLLDGSDQLWVTGIVEGTENGTWSWPQRG